MIVNGKTEINKIEYETVCECVEPPASQYENPDDESCLLNKLKLQLDREGTGLS